MKEYLVFINRSRHINIMCTQSYRFQSSAYRSNQWRYRGRVDSINFMVDKRIFIVGYGLYGSSSGAADYSVRIELKKYGEVMYQITYYERIFCFYVRLSVVTCNMCKFDFFFEEVG